MKFSDSFSEEGSGAARSIISWTSGKVTGATRTAAGVAGAARNRTVGWGVNALNDRAKNSPVLNDNWLGAAIRRNTVGRAAKSEVLGGKQFGEIRKTREENYNERTDNLKKIEARKDTKRLGVLNGLDVEKTGKRLDELAKYEQMDTRLGELVRITDRPLTEAEDNENARLLKEKRAMFNKEGKTFDELRPEQAELTTKANEASAQEHKPFAELRTEQSRLAKNVTEMPNKEIISLKGGDIEGIIKQITEGQLKAIKESNKYSKDAFERINRKWNEENSKAPKNEVIKNLQDIGKLYDSPRTKPAMDEIDTLIPLLKQYVKPTGEITLTLQGAESLKKEVTEHKENFEDINENRANGAAERQAANVRAKALKTAEAKLDEAIKHLKNVGPKIGGEEAPAALKLKP